MRDIDEAKARLPLPQLMEELGHGAHAKGTAKSPFRPDRNPSFGIFHKDGTWAWKDHGTNEGGDEITYLEKALELSRKDAIAKFLEMAGIRREQKPQPTKYKLASQPGLWQKLHAAADAEFLTQIAASRGLEFETLEWAHQLGIIGNKDGMPAFKNGDGAHHKAEDGGWRFLPKGTECEALTFGDVTSRDIYVFESQWDALAIADAIGIEKAEQKFFVSTRGASNGRLAGKFSENKNVYVFPQNDPPKPNGKIPSEDWWNDVEKACEDGMVLRVQIPRKYKDANDWVRDGAKQATILAAIQNAYDPILATVEIQTYGDLWKYRPEKDETVLLGNRWVCQGGQLLLVGQSGIGKSSLSMQAAMTWALGKPFFGIMPKKALKSLIVQAENDVGDMAEIVQGVMQFVIRQSQMDEAQAVKILTENVHFARVTADVSDGFIKVVDRLLDRHGEKDLVFGDPLLSYVGGDISRQDVMSHFLRQLCNPVAFRRRFAWVWSHHTGKPQSDSKARSHWNTNDYAYIGMGSSELTNWARAIAVLQTTKYEGTFRLLLAKRGKRAGVVDNCGQPETEIILKHAANGLHWEAGTMPEETEQEKQGRPGRPSKLTEAQKIELLAMAKAWPAGYAGLYGEAQKRFNVCEKTIKNYLKQQ